MTKLYNFKLVAVLLCMLTCMSGTAFGQQLASVLPNQNQNTLPEDHDPWNVSMPLTDAILRNMAQPVEKKQSPKKALLDQGEEFVFLGQSFYAGYAFSYDGGDIINRTANLTIDGDKVTFHAFFNYGAQSTDWNVSTDEDFEGVYDAEAKTITVATPNSGDDICVVAHTYGGYYDIVMLGGTANESGQFAPDGEIVFDVVGDFEQIKARNHVMLFSFANGYMMGATAGFRSFSLYKPNPDKAAIVSMSNSVSFDKNYSGNTLSKAFSLFNVGGQDAYVNVTVANDEAFAVNPARVYVQGSSSADFSVDFTPATAGFYTTTATFTSEGSDDITVTLEGNAIDMTDFSPIVTEGEMTITTGLENAFTLEELNGKLYAVSGGANIRRAQSDLFVDVVVPEGKKGTLSWDGEFTSEYPYNIGGVILDEVIVMQMYGQFTRDFGGTITDIAPGLHNFDFQYFNDNYYGGICINNLKFVLEDLPSDKVSCKRDVISLGHHLLANNDDIQGAILLYNEGSNELLVNSATCDNKAFTIDLVDFGVATFETLELPISLNTNECGVYEGTATIETSAGTITVPVKAGLYDPDYTKILKEGSAPFEFGTYDNMYYQNGSPFIVNEDAEVPYAYNASAKEIDYDPLTSCLEARFTVPEGYMGHLSWEGTISCAESEDPAEWMNYDYPYISVCLNWYPDWNSYWNNYGFYLAGANNGDAGSAQYDDPTKDETVDYYYNTFQMGEGQHCVSFCYNQLGDAYYEADDCLKIYNLCLELIPTTGIGNVTDTKTVATREYYNLAGVRVNKPEGVVIEKIKYSDGSESTKKILK